MTLNVSDIEHRFEEAARIISRQERGLRCTQEELSSVHEVRIWAGWLDSEERKLVWTRALGHSWRTMCCKMGMSRTTVWKMWTAALLKIHAKLKENES